MKSNLIVHYQGGSSDKVYVISIRDNNDTTFSVIGKWGRRGNVNQQTVKATVRSVVAAEVEQRKLFQEKLAGGYQDIDSNNYSGLVTRASLSAAGVLEPEVGVGRGSSIPASQKAPRQKPPKPAPELPGEPVQAEPAPITKPVLPEDDGVMVCVNNAGMEDKFDKGIEYVVEEHKHDDMIWAYDKFGKKAEYFKDRFMLPSQFKMKGQFYQPKPGETVRFEVLKNRENDDKRATTIVESIKDLMSEMTNVQVNFGGKRIV